MNRLIIIILIIFLSSCGNEMSIQAPYKDLPVVYCILNQNDSSHFIRLEKSFAGEMNAFDMASEFDSIYYPEADVKLERWVDGEFVESIDFEETNSASRDEGIFASSPNRVYTSNAILSPSGQYRLNIAIPGKKDTISALTNLVNDIRIIKPPYTMPALPLSQYQNDTRVEWVSTEHARVYLLQIRFNYLEVQLRDTTQKSMVWKIAHYVSEHNKGGQKMKADILNEQFYKWLNGKMPPPQDGIKRIAHKEAIDFIFTIGGEELYTFMQIYDPNQGIHQEKPVYTNISGGIGLFSARFEQELKGKALTYPSIDSLAWGIYTKSLGFVSSRDDYYKQ